MGFRNLSLAVLLAVTLTSALRPQNISICDYYTPLATGKNNSAPSQYEFMLKITHTFILGNYTQPNNGVKVAGIASPGTFDGHQVNLLPYFTGGYASTNTDTGQGVALNWLDSGGASALLANIPANSTSSHQYQLLTHVYQYFGIFFGCSFQGAAAFPSYQGVASQYEVHKYMDLNKYEVGYFNQQVMLAVKSLGFEQPDLDFTLQSLQTVFGNRCSPATKVIPPSAGPQLQSVCIAADCPLDPNATCPAYPNNGLGQYPIIANASLVGSIVKENDTNTAPLNGTSTSVNGSATGSSTSPAAATFSGASSPLWPHTGGLISYAVDMALVMGVLVFIV